MPGSMPQVVDQYKPTIRFADNTQGIYCESPCYDNHTRSQIKPCHGSFQLYFIGGSTYKKLPTGGATFRTMPALFMEYLGRKQVS